HYGRRVEVEHDCRYQEPSCPHTAPDRRSHSSRASRRQCPGRALGGGPFEPIRAPDCEVTKDRPATATVLQIDGSGLPERSAGASTGRQGLTARTVMIIS